MNLKPLKNLTISSKFGPRIDPVKKVPAFHSGVDFPVPANTPCLGVADGVVEISKVNGGGVHTGYGNYLVVQHDGFYVIYAHLVKLGLPVGTRVTEGMEVARTGNTGNTTGPHLHFEVRLGKINSDTFSKNISGMMIGAVDPETFEILPEYARIIKTCGGDEKFWIKFIEDHKGEAVASYFPSIISKVYKRR